MLCCLLSDASRGKKIHDDLERGGRIYGYWFIEGVIVLFFELFCMFEILQNKKS